MSTPLPFGGVLYLIPEGNFSHIILPGQNIAVLIRQMHPDGSVYFTRAYVPKANSALTLEDAIRLFPGAVIAERTENRIPNPRIGK